MPTRRSQFADRLDAGRRLAPALERYRGAAVILGMARGGVVVGYALAHELALPLQALVVRKVGSPENRELALGAVTGTGAQWLDEHLVAVTGATDTYLAREIAFQEAEARRLQQRFAARPGLDTVRGKTAIIVDDGIATGASALVAVRSARSLGAVHVVLAVPVASAQAIENLHHQVDDLVILSTPNPFLAVGIHYDDFGQVSDAEVEDCLRRAEESSAL